MRNRLAHLMGLSESAVYVDIMPRPAPELMVIFYRDCGRSLSEPTPVSALRTSEKFTFDEENGTWSWEGWVEPRRTFFIGHIRLPTEHTFVPTGPCIVYDAANPAHRAMVRLATAMAPLLLSIYSKMRAQRRGSHG